MFDNEFGMEFNSTNTTELQRETQLSSKRESNSINFTRDDQIISINI